MNMGYVRTKQAFADTLRRILDDLDGKLSVKSYEDAGFNIFDMFDTDGSGTLQPEDIKDALGQMGVEI